MLAHLLHDIFLVGLLAAGRLGLLETLLDLGPHARPQLGDELDIDVRLEERRAELLEKCVDDLRGGECGCQRAGC